METLKSIKKGTISIVSFVLVQVLFFSVFVPVSAFAQEIKEVVQPLSKNASQGILFSVNKDDAGNLDVGYRMKLDKKKNEIIYEYYMFDKNLKFIKSEKENESKEKFPNRQKDYFSAYIGGTTSFDILSQKLKIYQVTKEEYWNYSSQRYETKKILSQKTIKPKNDNGKTYNAYADFWEYTDAGISQGLIIAKVEEKGSSQKQYLLLKYDAMSDLSEISLDLQGAYTLVYAGKVENDDVVMVFAPNKGSADLTKYVYYRYDIEGNQKNKSVFTSPASALLISAIKEKGGDVYLFGTSEKTNDAYEKVYSEYSPIYNPGAMTAKMKGANYKDEVWRKCFNKSMDYFHLLKFSGNQLVFASKVQVKDLKSKFKTAPKDKGATMYKGKKFNLQNFYITPSGDYLVAGQLTGSEFYWIENQFDSYDDIVCFQFAKNGDFKVQYGVGRFMDNKDSKLYPLEQYFYPSQDGKTIYWLLLEPKVYKNSYADWYYGMGSSIVTFPRIAVMDLASESLLKINNLGNGKYFLNGKSQILEGNQNLLLVGGDAGGKNLWLCNAELK